MTDTIRLGKQEYRVVASLTTEQIEEQGLTRHAAELKQNGVIRELIVTKPRGRAQWHVYEYSGDRFGELTRLNIWRRPAAQQEG